MNADERPSEKEIAIMAGQIELLSKLRSSLIEQVSLLTKVISQTQMEMLEHGAWYDYRK